MNPYVGQSRLATLMILNVSDGFWQCISKNIWKRAVGDTGKFLQKLLLRLAKKTGK